MFNFPSIYVDPASNMEDRHTCYQDEVLETQSVGDPTGGEALASVFFYPVLFSRFNFKFLFSEVGPHRFQTQDSPASVQVLLFTWTNYAWHLSLFTIKKNYFGF